MLGRSGKRAWLSVDTQRNVSGTAPGYLSSMETDNVLFIGRGKKLPFEDQEQWDRMNILTIKPTSTVSSNYFFFEFCIPLQVDTRVGHSSTFLRIYGGCTGSKDVFMISEFQTLCIAIHQQMKLGSHQRRYTLVTLVIAPIPPVSAICVETEQLAMI